MARMALTVVGGVVGSFVGMPQLGAMIGSVVGSFVERAMMPDTYGPKLDDTKVSINSYGAPVGIAYGMGDFQCEQIWVKGGERQARETSQSSGGKGGPSYITTQYYATFAALICDSEIGGIRRIFLGRELVYDGTSEALSAAIIGGDPLPLTGAVEGVTFRAYLGTATQQPDPSIQAENPQASAYRGFAYIVFDDLPLESFGNEIPPVFVEVVTAGQVNKLDVGLTQYTHSDDPDATFDPARSRLFKTEEDSNLGGSNMKVEIYDMLGGVKERTDDLSGTPAPWATSGITTPNTLMTDANGLTLTYHSLPPAPAPDGSFYVICERWTGATEGGTGIVVDAETGQYQSTLSTVVNKAFGFPDVMGFAGKPLWHCVRRTSWAGLDPATGLPGFAYLRGTNRGIIHYGRCGMGPTDAIRCDGRCSLSNFNTTSSWLACDIRPDGDYIYAFYNRSDNVRILSRIPIIGLSVQDASLSFIETADITVEVTTDIGLPIGMVYDPDAEKVFIAGQSGNAVYDAGLSHVVTNLTDDRGMGFNMISGHMDGVVWFQSSRASADDEIHGYSTEDGSITTLDFTEWGLSDICNTDPIWRIRSDIWIGNVYTDIGSTPYAKQPILFYGDRVGVDKITLASVLLNSAQRAGLTASQLDLTAVTRLIYGAPQKSPQVNARGIWEDLLIHTDHEAALIDGKLTVTPRATSSQGTITDLHLGADDGPPLMRRTNTNEVLRRVEVNYKSVPANLEAATQADEFPVDVVPEGDVIRFGTSLIMDDDEAWADAQRLLAIGSSERTEMEIAVPYVRRDIDPGHIWTISADAGAHDMRVKEITGDGVLQVKGRAAWPFLNASGTPIDTSRAAPQLAEISATDFALIDGHIWRDEDDNARFTVAAWPRRSYFQWDGGLVFRSTDPDVFTDEFFTIDTASIVGAATGALGDIPSCGSWDRANSLTVRMVNGTPVSATEAQVLTGSNPVWVQCGSTGEWELIQFAGATENADGTWTLSNLLRGRRGTEHLTASHAIGDRVVWADELTARRVGGSQIGTEFYYISQSIGGTQNLSTRRAFTNSARGLRPYSVARVRGSRDGSSNLTVTWLRRSRQTGIVWRSTRPLAESTESYEIDVMNGASVVRTITATSATASYTAAEQTTDFGSTQSSVTLRIYQMSATFGRGVVKEATV